MPRLFGNRILTLIPLYSLGCRRFSWIANDDLEKLWVKVTAYLQRCLAYKRCGMSGLSCRYLKPRIKLKLIGGAQGGKSPFSLLSEPISPSSLNGYVSFSPSSLLFPPISPSSQLCLGHFSLLPILFLPLLIGLAIRLYQQF